MVFLYRKKVREYEYWYFAENKRINGVTKRAWEEFAGTTEQLYEKFKASGNLDDIALKSYSFGKTAAILSVNEELGFTDIVDSIVPKPWKNGTLTAGQYLLAFITGRCEEPVSKNGMEEWFEQSYLRFLWKFNHTLSCQNFLNQMSYLTEDRMKEISKRICRKLVSLGYSPTRIFFDTTNFATEMNPDDDEEQTLAKPGFSKEGKHQNNIIGTAIGTTDDNLPFPIETYSGNLNDTTVFSDLVEDILTRIEDMGTDPKKMVLVIDKGCNSKENIDAVVKRIHIVGSLNRCHVPDLMKIPLTRYRHLYTTEKEHKILGYRTVKETLGRKFTVVVAYNEESMRKQEKNYQTDKNRFLKTVRKIKNLANTLHRGRKSSVESIIRKIIDAIPRKRQGVFKFHVGATIEKKFDVMAWVDKQKERELYRGFGKTIVFTDRNDWNTTEIVKTYMARWMIEDDFKLMKDRLIIPVMPIYHRNDLPIKVHIFLCVMGLLFYRYMMLKMKKEGISLPSLLTNLDRIRIGVVISKTTKKVRHVVEDMEMSAARIFSVLKMDRFLLSSKPN